MCMSSIKFENVNVSGFYVYDKMPSYSIHVGKPMLTHLPQITEAD